MRENERRGESKIQRHSSGDEGDNKNTPGRVGGKPLLARWEFAKPHGKVVQL
jgi:hypothetical protein